MTKKMSLFMAIVLMLCMASSAMATTGETGDLVSYSNGEMSIYDVDVIEVIPANEVHNGVSVAAAPSLAKGASAITSAISKQVSSGALQEAAILGYEDQGSLESQMNAAVAELAAVALEGNPKMSVAFEEGLDKMLSATSGAGYVIVGTERVPYVRLVIKVVYPDSGKYAGLSEEARTVYENYVFIYDAASKNFKLHSIMTYRPNY